DRVVTVENLTSFYEVVNHLPPRTVAVYLGGYHNRPRRELLLKLAASAPLSFFHWGDIDLGGFRILVHLKARTGLPIQPLLMDRETYLEHQANGMDFSTAYAKEVGALLDRPDFAPFRATVQEMVRCRRRVEQESVAFRPAW
ncbi:MAG TPA: Wadjet anti-phage system protein JetD domain-containing protein, partial [Symbiobacteriaceae bacterium]|nr:Wadjet anti-phage system protein JetD domain-containing protein [Symbiobacteriaceae bacterium]